MAVPLFTADITAYTNAHDLYNRGRFTEARDAYLSLARTGDPDIYYDLGACYLALNDVGHAMLWFKRAEKRAPGDADIQAGLRMARALTSDRIESPETPAVMQGILFFYYLIPLQLQAVLSLIFAAGIAVSLMIFILLDSAFAQRIAFITGVASIVLTVTFTASSVLRYRSMYPENSAVITVKSADVLSGSDDGYTVLITLHAGTVVTIRGVRPKYVNISLANGASGWVLRETLERI